MLLSHVGWFLYSVQESKAELNSPLSAPSTNLVTGNSAGRL